MSSLDENERPRTGTYVAVLRPRPAITGGSNRRSSLHHWQEDMDRVRFGARQPARRAILIGCPIDFGFDQPISIGDSRLRSRIAPAVACAALATSLAKNEIRCNQHGVRAITVSAAVDLKAPGVALGACGP